VSNSKGDLSRLGELAAGLDLHQHLCFIYETQDEQFAAALPFLRSGLERGGKCFFVADQNSGNAVLNALRKAGTQVDRYLKNGELILANKPDVRPGRFDPDWCIGFLSRSIRGAGDDRLSGVSTWLGEMAWAVAEETAPETLIEFEAKINYFVRDHDVRTLCQYRREHFSPELILGIIRTHPVVVYGGIVCKNPYYVPPEEFLKPNQAALEVERLLSNMLAQEQALAHLRALAARLQRVREDERTIVAREVHDELGQALTAAKMEIRALLRDFPTDEARVSQRGQSVLKLLDEAIQSVRKIATELRPAILDDLGLGAALEWLAEDFQGRTGTNVEVSLPDPDIAIDRDGATALFRIVQETLTNVARHAAATRVDVRLAKENRDLILEVRDNGKGFNQEELSTRTSLGFLGMRERVLLLGGTLTINSTLGKGTTVRVLIPASSQVAE